MRKLLLLTSAFMLLILASNAQTLTDSLLMYYPFSGNANDMSGNGFDATEMGNVSLTTDRFGNVASAYYFDGVDDYLSIPHDNGYKKSLPLTLSAWIFMEGDDNVHQIFNTDNSSTVYAGANINVVNALPGGSFKRGSGSPGSGTRETIQSTDSLSKNEWHHLSIVMYAADSMELYVDGIRDTNYVYSGSGIILGYTTSEAVIGHSKDYFAPIEHFYYEGKIDEVMYWNRGLSSTEVQELYNKTSESAVAIVNTGSNGVCEGNSLDINITNTVDDVEYTLYLASDSSNVDSALGGSDITLNTGNLTSSTDYVIYGDNNALADNLGTSLLMEQASNSVSFGNFSVPGGEFTIEFWMNDSMNTQHFGRMLMFGGAVYQLAILDDKRLGFSNNGSWQYPAMSDTLIDKNEWNHIALSVGSGQYSLFVNGKNILSNAINAFTTITYFRLGQGGNASAAFLYDELKIWDYAKNSTQIMSSTRNAVAVATSQSDLLGYYQFEEGMGSSIYNQADTINNGTINGMDTTTVWVSGLHHNATDYSFTVNVSSLATLTSTVDDANGSIDLTVAGGMAPFTFDWDNDGTGDNDDSEDLTDLSTGTYNVTVVDDFGCESTHQVSITVDAISNSIEQFVDVYPNPTTHFINIDLKENNSANYRLINLVGENIESSNITNQNNKLDVSTLENGIYFLEIEIGGKKMINTIVKQ